VLGTEATAQRAYTRDLIERFAGGCRVILVGSADLVRLAETHADRSAPPAGAIESILAPFFDRADSERPDVLVLACTHFPLLRDQLQAACPEGVRLIDSGAAVARRVASLLGPGDPTEADPVRLACVTGAGDRRDLLKAEGFGRVETLRLAETLRHMTAN
jgi:glutamate racemase